MEEDLSEETRSALHESIDQLEPCEAAVIRLAFGIEGSTDAAKGMTPEVRRATRSKAIRKLLTLP